MPKLKALLKKLGMSQANIDLVTAADAETNEAFDVEAVSTETVAAFQTSMENDTEFMDKLRGNVAASVLGAKERHIIRSSNGLVTDADIKALPQEGRFDRAIELLVTKTKASAGQSNTDKDAEIARLNKAVQERDEDVRKLREVELPAAHNKAKEVEDKIALKQAIRSIATKDRKTVLDVERTVDLLYADISAEHDLILDPETKKPVVKQKGKDVLAYSAKDRSKPLDLDELVPSVGETAGYFVKNNGGDKPDKPAGGTSDPDAPNSDKKPRWNLPGLAAAQRAEAENAAK